MISFGSATGSVQFWNYKYTSDPATPNEIQYDFVKGIPINSGKPLFFLFFYLLLANVSLVGFVPTVSVNSTTFVGNGITITGF